MTNKEKIIECMKGKEKAHITEISKETGVLKNSVMGCLNKHVLLDKCFTRLGKGYYKLKEENKDGDTQQKGSDGKESNETEQQEQPTK